ncbi:MAG: ribosome-associated protein [Urechidicola sp.]|jgi:ribosome-associated protein|tara:strand:+ start:2525 stop:2947 length:423 start_codon:yes stop_codon:yes gene_type:complete
MKNIFLLIEEIKKELVFETSRSSGKGGQHVNKTESRVTLVWSFTDSNLISEKEKELIVSKVKTYISGNLIRISTEENRSQIKNKKKSIYKLKSILEEAFKVDKLRKKSRVPRSVKEKRIKTKKQKGEIKKSRKKIDKREF